MLLLEEAYVLDKRTEGCRVVFPDVHIPLFKLFDGDKVLQDVIVHLTIDVESSLLFLVCHQLGRSQDNLPWYVIHLLEEITLCIDPSYKYFILVFKLFICQLVYIGIDLIIKFCNPSSKGTLSLVQFGTLSLFICLFHSVELPFIMVKGWIVFHTLTIPIVLLMDNMSLISLRPNWLLILILWWPWFYL